MRGKMLRVMIHSKERDILFESHVTYVGRNPSTQVYINLAAVLVDV